MTTPPRHISAAERAADEILAIPNRTIPEPIFVTHFLPKFADPSGTADITEWFRVAGNWRAEVDVVDQQGNIIFTVPPLLRDVPFKGDDTPANNIGDVLEVARLKSQAHPGLGDAYLEDELAKRFGSIAPDIEGWKRMNAIFERYGYPVIKIDGVETPVTTAPADSNNLSGNIVYEDDFE